MTPGDFRHKTTIREQSMTQNTNFGYYLDNGSELHNVFAKIKWLPGQERMDGEQLNFVKNVELTYRYYTLTKLLGRIDSIEIGDDKYYIKSIQYIGHANQQYVVIQAHTAIN